MYRTYEHKAQYYETDQMGIVHHSNYIRWFEEARVDLMDQAGLGYKKMEEAGIISPVLSVEAQYKSMVHFEDVVVIEASIEKYNGIKMTVSYVIKDKSTGAVRCEGKSRHCFLDRDGRPIYLKKAEPAFHKLFEEICGGTIQPDDFGYNDLTETKPKNKDTILKLEEK